ncbi:MAG: hypothetical protein JWM99_212 [Verrucomicrobiales bacterium]|nr:hypothetical protein [Verrucomicrobiales bacterium]
MSSAPATVTEEEILSHTIATLGQDHWQQLACLLSELKLPAPDLDRVDSLLEKNRSAVITDQERLDLDKYLRVGSFLDLLRARASRELTRTPA